MIFAHFRTDVNESNMFLVACESSGEALLVDAAAFEPRLQTFLEAHQLTLSSVFITHGHYDHVEALPDIVRAYNPKVYVGRGAAAHAAATQVGQDDRVPVGLIEARVVALPGHTPDGVGLILPGMIFTGDALFAGSIGGTSSLHDKAIEIDHIRRRVFSLPDEYEVHPGHGPSSTVFIEKTYNPFFV